ncbi:MAG: hypothetical protein AAF629_15825 [Chloroflexota bacterium]
MMSLVSMPDITYLATTASMLQPEEQPVRDLVLLLFVIVISAISLVALVIFIRAVFPQTSQRSQRYLQRSPWRSFFIGLVNYIFILGIIGAITSVGVDGLNLVAVLILGVLIMITAVGLSGLCTLTGQRIAELRDRETSLLQQVVWGIVTVEFACLLPFVGWFLFAPLFLMISFGAAVLGWRNRKTAEFEMS